MTHSFTTKSMGQGYCHASVSLFLIIQFSQTVLGNPMEACCLTDLLLVISAAWLDSLDRLVGVREDVCIPKFLPKALFEKRKNPSR